MEKESETVSLSCASTKKRKWFCSELSLGGSGSLSLFARGLAREGSSLSLSICDEERKNAELSGACARRESKWREKRKSESEKTKNEGEKTSLSASPSSLHSRPRRKNMKTSVGPGTRAPAVRARPLACQQPSQAPQRISLSVVGSRSSLAARKRGNSSSHSGLHPSDDAKTKSKTKTTAAAASSSSSSFSYNPYEDTDASAFDGDGTQFGINSNNANNNNGTDAGDPPLWRRALAAASEAASSPAAAAAAQVGQTAASLLFVVLYVWSTYSSPPPGGFRQLLDAGLCFVFAADYMIRLAVRRRSFFFHFQLFFSFLTLLLLLLLLIFSFSSFLSSVPPNSTPTTTSVRNPRSGWYAPSGTSSTPWPCSLLS